VTLEVIAGPGTSPPAVELSATPEVETCDAHHIAKKLPNIQ